ncbi:MAG: molybdopterin-binding/glycosyltransferase family 2 protein [Myxococcota bacterium]
MKFGPVSLASNGGAVLDRAILAHTLRLADGGTLKKGHRLVQSDLERLKDAGIESIVVAQLEGGDIDENETARRVASALSHESLQVRDAHTGRVNIHAGELGVAIIDADAVDRINSISEDVTLATIAPFSTVKARSMVATIKVIPFGVSESVVATVCSEVSRCSQPVIEVRGFQPRRVGLILTHLSGTKPALLMRASEVQRTRLRQLEAQISCEVRCEHRASKVSEAICTLREDHCDVILILGASAIVDRRDVIPRALGLAGGSVVHLGMPVDPGNLLMFGTLDDNPVIGLPGCARSIQPSGFDQVLQRVMAGLPVDSAVIQRMGSGGLLKEIEARPQPRTRRAKRKHSARVGGVLLAAGLSRRMGATNKLLAEIDGVPLVRRATQVLKKSRLNPVTVVLGHDAERIKASLMGIDVEFVSNPDFADGMGTSIRAGIEVLARQEVDAAIVALADMPWIRPEHVDALIDAFDPEGESTVCMPVYGRKRGNPVLWSAAHFDALRSLSGDVGGRAVLDRVSPSICYVEIDEAAIHADVDTPQALAELKSGSVDP